MSSSSRFICGLLTLLLLPLIPLRGQNQSQEQKDKFSRRQRLHLKIYADVQATARNRRVPDDKVFQAFYGPVAESCREHLPRYQKVAADLVQRQEAALAANRTDQAEQLQKAQLAYQAIADACQTIVKAFEAGETRPLQLALREYAAAEKELDTLRLQRLPREWFTPQEAEKIYVAENRRVSGPAVPPASRPIRNSK